MRSCASPTPCFAASPQLRQRGFLQDVGAGGVHGAGRERGGGAERCEVTTPQGTAGRHGEAPTQTHRTQLTRSLVTSAPVQRRGNRRSHACSVSSPGRTSSRLPARAAQPHIEKASFLGEMGFYGPADPPGKFGGAQGQLSHRRCLTAALPLSPPPHGTGDADPQHGDGQWPWPGRARRAARTAASTACTAPAHCRVVSATGSEPELLTLTRHRHARSPRFSLRKQALSSHKQDFGCKWCG